MRNAALLVVVLSASSVVHAQGDSGGPFKGGSGSYGQLNYEAQSKAQGCNSLANKALNLNGNGYGGYGYSNPSVPFKLNDGNVEVFDQGRIVSRETIGNVETIEYKVNEIVGYKNDKPVSEMVRKIVHIKRQGGKIASITHPQDLKRQAQGRAYLEKQFGKADFKLFKSLETTLKVDGNGLCETDQKAVIVVKDEKGNEAETQVTYDSGFCERLQPTLARIGNQNATECGHLISTAERLASERNKELKKDGKVFVANGVPDSKIESSTLGTSMAITMCIQESQSAIAGMSPGYGYGMGGGMGAYLGTGLMSGMYEHTSAPTKSISKPKKVKVIQ